MHRVPTPTLPSSTRGKAGRNRLNEEITPLLPTRIGERYSQTISNLRHAALLRRCELQGLVQLDGEGGRRWRVPIKYKNRHLSLSCLPFTHFWNGWSLGTQYPPPPHFWPNSVYFPAVYTALPFSLPLGPSYIWDTLLCFRQLVKM
jgi:hypothetical protein